MKAAGVSAAALGTATSLKAEPEGEKQSDVLIAPETKFPKLAIITNYSSQKLAFVTRMGYEGVVVKVGKAFNPYPSDGWIAKILAISRETGCCIISAECFYDLQGKGINHIAPDPAERRSRPDSTVVRQLSMKTSYGTLLRATARRSFRRREKTDSSLLTASSGNIFQAV